MRKRYATVLLSLTGLLGLCVLTGVTSVQAQTQQSLSEAHRQRIIASCTSAQASLSQLHRSDASIRFSQGRLYEFVSSKLMAHMNSRLALNKLDSAQLVDIVVKYEKSVDAFREAYRQYEVQLSTVLKIDCTTRPDEFYYGVLDAQTKRLTVNTIVRQLISYAEQYQKQFDQFAAPYLAVPEKEGSRE